MPDSSIEFLSDLAMGLTLLPPWPGPMHGTAINSLRAFFEGELTQIVLKLVHMIPGRFLIHVQKGWIDNRLNCDSLQRMSDGQLADHDCLCD